MPLTSDEAPITATVRRAEWRAVLVRWHWISSALCLIGMLLFAATGITLNHASQIEARPKITHFEDLLPASLIAQLAEHDHQLDAALPVPLRDWLLEHWSLRVGERRAEWSADEVYLALPRPGGDAWLSIELEDGAIEYERTDRGWIAYLNDLHKGRNTGVAWGWFIDVFAVACLVFCITGLLLLHLHARQRAFTWPMVTLGLLVPLVLVILFIH